MAMWVLLGGSRGPDVKAGRCGAERSEAPQQPDFPFTTPELEIASCKFALPQ